jgi:hypothetical protein
VNRDRLEEAEARQAQSPDRLSRPSGLRTAREVAMCPAQLAVRCGVGDPPVDRAGHPLCLLPVLHPQSGPPGTSIPGAQPHVVVHPRGACAGADPEFLAIGFLMGGSRGTMAVCAPLVGEPGGANAGSPGRSGQPRASWSDRAYLGEWLARTRRAARASAPPAFAGFRGPSAVLPSLLWGMGPACLPP